MWCGFHNLEFREPRDQRAMFDFLSPTGFTFKITPLFHYFSESLSLRSGIYFTAFLLSDAFPGPEGEVWRLKDDCLTSYGLLLSFWEFLSPSHGLNWRTEQLRGILFLWLKRNYIFVTTLYPKCDLILYWLSKMFSKCVSLFMCFPVTRCKN